MCMSVGVRERGGEREKQRGKEKESKEEYIGELLNFTIGSL